MPPPVTNINPASPTTLGATNSAADFDVFPAPADRRGKALWTVFAQAARQERLGQVAAILAAGARGVVSLEQLLIACRGGRIVGAAFAIPGAGRSAQVWPCRLAAGEPAAVADALFDEQERRLAAIGVRFVQAFIDLDENGDAAALTGRGYAQIGDLVWMACRVGCVSIDEPATNLEFIPFDGDLDRLEKIVDRTYVGTLDCPAMNDLRRTRDVLEGYQSAATYRPDRWWFVAHRGQTLGCLLLADQAECDRTELVYCGVAPEFRGAGAGREMTRFAQWIARRDGRQGIVLSVDASNRPALSIYAEAGFRAYDRRRVLAKGL